MLSFKDYLTERILSIGFNHKDELYREKHRQEIHDLLRNAYAHPDIGGYGGLPSGSKEESNSIHHDITHSLIKTIRRNGKITAVNLYKPQHGRKIIATATDKTEQGKKDWNMMQRDDNTQKRAWGEVSGAVEKLQTRAGVPKITSDVAAKLINKPINPNISDPYKYSRLIGGHEHEKTVMGHPKID